MYIVTYTYKDQKQKFHETILSLLRIIHTVSLFSLFKNKMLVATHYIDFLIQLFKNTDLTDLSFPCPGEYLFDKNYILEVLLPRKFLPRPC